MIGLFETKLAFPLGLCYHRCGDDMKTIRFSALYTADFHLENVFAMRQKWRRKGFFEKATPRQTACLLWFCGCVGRYYTAGKCFTVPLGSVVYIPEGSVYKTDFIDFTEGETDTVLVEFSLLSAEGEYFNLAEEITVVQEEGDPLLFQWLEQLADAYTAHAVSLASIKALVYQIIDRLCRVNRQQNLLSPRFQTIASGISFLEKEHFREKSMKEIAEMCYVSPAYFRRLFKEYAGVTPMEYRLNARMEYAKKLLAIGAMNTGEVARAVGFEDPAYFCRVFKKRVGVSPGKYMQLKEKE